MNKKHQVIEQLYESCKKRNDFKFHNNEVKKVCNGYHFYEQQKTRLGSYFLDSLFSDIDSLLIYSGSHSIFLPIAKCPNYRCG